MNGLVPPRRRGVTMVIVLATLMMLAIISSALVRLTLLQTARARLEVDRTQADWLVQAGFERAWTRLARQPDYEGETWLLDAADLDGKPASVRIAVRRTGPDQPLSIDVKAEYPLGSAAATIRTSQTFQASPTAGPAGDLSP